MRLPLKQLLQQEDLVQIQVPLPPPQALPLPVHLERVLILLEQVLEVSLERLQQQILALQLVPPQQQEDRMGVLEVALLAGQ